MGTYDFKNDLTNSIFRLMGRIILVAIIAQVVVALINFLASMLILPGFTEFTQSLQGAMDFSSGDPEEIFSEMLGLFQENGYSTGKILLISLVGMLLSYITYNIIFNAIKSEVSSGDNSIGSAMSNLFDARLIKYLVYSIIIGLAIAIVSIILAFIPILGVLLILFAVMPVGMWFVYVGTSAIGIDNNSIGDSLKLAASNLTVGRAAKFLGIGIIAIIAFAVMGMIIGLISGLVGAIPGVGLVLSQIIGALIGAIITAFTLAGASGLYYRYSGHETQNEEQYVVTD